MNAGLAGLAAIGLLVIVLCAVLLVRRARRERSHRDATLSLGTRLGAWTEHAEHRLVSESAVEPIAEAPSASVSESDRRVDEGEASQQALPTEVLADSSPTHPEETPHAAVEITLDGATVVLAEDTEEHERLRAYADTLLTDLKAARRASR